MAVDGIAIKFRGLWCNIHEVDIYEMQRMEEGYAERCGIDHASLLTGRHFCDAIDLHFSVLFL